MGALLGPLQFILDSAPTNNVTGWIMLLILAMMILSFPLRPKPWSAFLAIFGLVIWLFTGAIGAGINS